MVWNLSEGREDLHVFTEVNRKSSASNIVIEEPFILRIALLEQAVYQQKTGNQHTS